jgi:PhzF family phenazine biosynthesis protein
LATETFMELTTMSLFRLAAFCDGAVGGNPAGVHVADALPDDATMQRIAADVGYSETAFTAPLPDGRWRVRYFAPEAEVPFCGHATIALGAVLARMNGDGDYALQLNDAAIGVHGRRDGDQFAASLRSPPTRSAPLDAERTAALLALFGLDAARLDPALPPSSMHAGADHALLAVRDRATLAAMDYDFAAGRTLMRAHGWVTVALAWPETPRRFHVRNAFASGGVHEDPATGAAAAAFAGLLRDRGWPHGGAIELLQGEDMGMPSRLHVTLDDVPGAPVTVSGRVRSLD